MKHYLFIAEKPSSMRAFQEVYNKHKKAIDTQISGDISFTALRGHIFRYQEPKEYTDWGKSWAKLYDEDLPMIPKVWKIKPISGAAQVIKDLKDQLSKGFDGIIVGTDSDVEGYGIYYMVCQALNLEKYPTLRFYETALTEKNILESFRNMEDLFTTPRHKNAIQAYLFRSKWDWLIGMNLTTAYTVRFGELIKFGSVKAPTLKLIYDNCNAIDNFKPTTTYGIKQSHQGPFESILINDDDQKDKSFATKKEADDVCSSLGDQAKVLSRVAKTVVQKPPKLYSLSDLQIDAAKAPYNYTPDKVLEIAQSLYETHKILTYPRTSGNYIASGKVKDFPILLEAIADIPDLKSFVSNVTQADMDRAAVDKNIVNDKEVAKAAHDALLPTGEQIKWGNLSQAEKDIFLLVCKRFLAHFLPYFAEEKVTLMLENNGFRFKANGRITLENGYNDLYNKTPNDVIIPDYKDGEVIDVLEKAVYEKISQPPKRYSMGSIIAAMKNIASQVDDIDLKKLMKESEGIGTEATRASIISDLKSSGYISVSKNMIYITDAGKRYIENIRREQNGKFDYGIADPVTVAFWSAKNKEIQIGEQTLDDIMDQFTDYLKKTLSDIKSSGNPIKFTPGTPKETLPACPLCGGKILSGKFGYFCENNKKGCKLSIPLEIAHKKLTITQKKQLIDGKIVQIKGMTSKTGKKFDGKVQLNKETGKIEFLPWN